MIYVLIKENFISADEYGNSYYNDELIFASKDSDVVIQKYDNLSDNTDYRIEEVESD